MSTAPATAGTAMPADPLARREVAVDLVAALAVLAALDIGPYVWASGAPDRIAALWSRWYLVAVGGCLVDLTLVASFLRYRRQTFASLGLAHLPIRRVLLAAAAAVPLCYLAAAVSTVVLLGLTGMGMVDVVALKRPLVLAFGTIPAWLVVPISLLVGLTEEIVFRGFLLVRLRALTGTAVGPALLTSALFGVAHYTQGLLGMVDSAAIGLVLAVFVLRTETLWPAIAAHATIDSLSLALALVLREHL